MYIQISLGTKFQLKLTIFLDQIYPKRVFPVKRGKKYTTTEFCIFELVCTELRLKLTILIFGPNLPKKDIPGQKQKKCSSLLNSIQWNQARHQEKILIIWNQICPKRIFRV